MARKELLPTGVKRVLNLVLFLILVGGIWMSWPSIYTGYKPNPHVELELKAKYIGMAMFQYALDPANNGCFPDGQSSTEVFQKLMDAGYISNPAILYVPMPGKTPATSNHLKPENVCWDVTGGVTTNDDDIPLVFLTGYKLNYQPDAALQPIKQNRFWTPWELWDAWWNNKPWKRDYVPVCYKSADVLTSEPQVSAPLPDGTIPDFIPKTFDAQGKTYRQLTP